MKLAEIDWSVLRGALILLVVALLVSGGLFYGSSYVHDQVERENRSEQLNLTRVRSEYQTIDDEQRIIETYLPQYRTLEERGIIGSERRLDWVETLRAAAAKIRLPSLRYELFPQGEYRAEFPLPQGAYKVYESTMRLDLGLLHEGDLVALLAELNRNSEGLFTVSSCSIRRNGEQVRFEPNVPNISASCELRWLTVRGADEDGAAS